MARKKGGEVMARTRDYLRRRSAVLLTVLLVFFASQAGAENRAHIPVAKVPVDSELRPDAVELGVRPPRSPEPVPAKPHLFRDEPAMGGFPPTPEKFGPFAPEVHAPRIPDPKKPYVPHSPVPPR